RARCPAGEYREATNGCRAGPAGQEIALDFKQVFGTIDSNKRLTWEGSAMLDRETRRRVLEAAGPIFAAKGFEATTVREICARAGATVSAVTYHFPSKHHPSVQPV